MNNGENDDNDDNNNGDGDDNISSMVRHVTVEL